MLGTRAGAQEHNLQQSQRYKGAVDTRAVAAGAPAAKYRNGVLEATRTRVLALGIKDGMASHKRRRKLKDGRASIKKSPPRASIKS